MNNPLVTIITITFNLVGNKRIETFDQCLNSVHDQSYDSIEHIVIDGGSQDGTVGLIEKYEQKKWIRYITEKDNGIYDAMNKGLKLAKGKYIAFLNSDDFYHRADAVKKSVLALEENDAAFSYAPAFMVTENDEPLQIKHPHMHPNIKSVYYTMPFCHQTMFSRREALLQENGFDASFKSAGDYDLVMRLCLKNYKSVFVEEPIVTFRFGGLSDANQQQSIDEVAKAYYKNYHELCEISEDDCRKIYCQDYNGITLPLAEALKDNTYFDYQQYVVDLENLRKHLAYLRTCCESAQKELAVIYASRSWKFTSFLRKAHRAFKGKLAL
jgi:glycosyltransferase involved in cell wall biosynthesis